MRGERGLVGVEARYSQKRTNRITAKPLASALDHIQQVSARCVAARLCFQRPAGAELVANAEDVRLFDQPDAVIDIELRREALAEHERGVLRAGVCFDVHFLDAEAV